MLLILPVDSFFLRIYQIADLAFSVFALIALFCFFKLNDWSPSLALTPLLNSLGGFHLKVIKYRFNTWNKCEMWWDNEGIGHN